MTMDNRLTNSEIICADTCKRKLYYAYVLGLRKQHQSEAIRIGNVFHNATDFRAKGDDPYTAKTKALEAYSKNAPSEFEYEERSKWERERALSDAIISTYFDVWAEADKQIELVESEISFEVPIINPSTGRPSRTFALAGKIDKIVRLPSGRYAIMEHKTTSNAIDPGSDYWKALRIDQQISIYIIAARQLGCEIDTCFYDVVKRTGMKPSKLTQSTTANLINTNSYQTKIDGEVVHIEDYPVNYNAETGDVFVDGEQAEIIPGKRGFAIRETPRMYRDRIRKIMRDNAEDYFVRQEIPRGGQALSDAQQNIWQQSQMIRENYNADRWPCTGDKFACTRMGRCPYFDICTNGGWKKDDYIPDGFEIVADVHQELIEEE